eukprot:m51a1_g3127 hypothetical protein (187) ;mRNA; r:246249-247020
MARAFLLVSAVIAAASAIVCTPDMLVGCNARPCSEVSCPGVEGATCVDATGFCGCYSYTMFNSSRLAAAECARPLGLRDSGRTLSLPFGHSFQVELEGNPSTGYQWTNVLTTDAEHGYVLPTWPVASEYKSHCPAPQAGHPIIVGCGGVFTYTFRALYSSQVHMVYSRAHQTEIAREFSLNVQLAH